MAKSLVYDGSNPSSPLRLLLHEIPTIQPDQKDQLLVKFVSAPINRVDLMVLAGQYPIKPEFSIDGHSIPGFDGCGFVVESSSPDFIPGDVIIPRQLGLGTWRTYALLPAKSLLKLPPDTPLLAGSLLRSSALIASLLLEELVPLEPRDWIIVSAGSSCVAQFFVQLAKQKAVNTALVIRDRESVAESRAKLLGLGAAKVLTESELAREGSDAFAGRVVLALDSVFGDVGQNLVEALSPGGRYVLVGMLGGSAGSIAVTTKHLFQKQLSFMCFRGSEVLKRIGPAKTDALLEQLVRLLVNGSLKCPDLRLADWKQATDDPKALQKLIDQTFLDAQSENVGYQKSVWVLS